MSVMEVILLVLGIGGIAASFFIPEQRRQEAVIDDELIRSLINKEMADTKGRIGEVVDETLNYAVEKTERSAERISNEKIMAINEYSETVLADINKTHQEVLFLYDMLNAKHNNIKETAIKVDKTAKEAEEKAQAVANVIEPAAPQQPQTPADGTKAADEKPQPEFRAITPHKVSASKAKVREYSFVEQAPHIDRSQVVNSQAVTAPSVQTQTMRPQTTQSQHFNEPAHTEPAVNNNNDRILRLHREGKSAVDIAKELGLGVGEVKLVINLFKGF